jgi:hypothetical protein
MYEGAEAKSVDECGVEGDSNPSCRCESPIDMDLIANIRRPSETAPAAMLVNIVELFDIVCVCV